MEDKTLGKTNNTAGKQLGKVDGQVIRTLARYYPLNEETKTFEIALHYEKASDIFEGNADTLDKAPRISDSITDRMMGSLDDIPKGYSADVFIRVDDYEGYTSQQLMNGLKDTLFLRHRRCLNETIQNGLKSGVLITAGLVMILILTIGKQIGWWGGDDTISEILTYLLDTLGCVLIWEGLYITFVEKPEEFVFEQKIANKVSSISFYQESKDRAAVSESGRNFSALMAINRKIKLEKRLLLFSGFSLICLAALWVLQTLGCIINPEVFGIKVTVELIVDMVLAVVIVAVGIMSLRAYAEKTRNLTVTLVIAPAVILYSVFSFVFMLLSEEGALPPIQMIFVIFTIFSELAFLVGYGMYIIQYWKDRRQG